MVDADRVRRLLVMLERYRGLLAEDDPDPYRRRHLVQPERPEVATSRHPSARRDAAQRAAEIDNSP